MARAPAAILIIDDDQDMCWALRAILGDIGFPVVAVGTGVAGLEIAMQAEPVAVLLDMQMPGLGGDEVMTRLQRQSRAIPIIVITGYGSIPGAIDTIRAGAFDYLTKPFDNDTVVAAVRRAIAQRSAGASSPDGDLWETVTSLMGHGPAIQSLIAKMELVINTDYSVLILGETGTGKELVAQALHRHGPRRSRPLVVLDCGTVVETLVDSELFGHERGAYTGAAERKRGRLELAADSGTIFLDEIGNLCLVGQQALLRVLEERVIYRVGGTTPIRLDTRVISATNADQVEDGNVSMIRPDLFYRLSEYTVIVPPLRARPGDIEFLARRFLDQAQRVLRRPMLDISADALDLLRSYCWPGNVRQLRNVVRRAGLMASAKITVEHIQACMPRRPTQIAVHAPAADGADVSLHGLVRHWVRQVEHDAILDALHQAGGNQAEAARQLHIDYKTFRTKLKTIKHRNSGNHVLAGP